MQFIKYVTITILVLISFSSSYGQQAEIADYFPRFNDKIDAVCFACNAADRTQGVYYAEIEFLNKDTIQITNHTPTPSKGGINIKILLDSTLKVINITYNEWSDVSDNYERTYSVESPSVLLNFNPFKNGINGFEGRYTFIIKTAYAPGELLQSKGEKPSVDYKLFYGRFKCD